MDKVLYYASMINNSCQKYNNLYLSDIIYNKTKTERKVNDTGIYKTKRMGETTRCSL